METDNTGTATYTWDWRNLLLSVSEPSGNTFYEYDGGGSDDGGGGSDDGEGGC